MGIHEKAVRQLVVERVLLYRKSFLNLVALSVAAGLWTALSATGEVPRDVALEAGGLLYLFLGTAIWACYMAARRLREALSLYLVAEQLGALPLTPTGLVDWHAAIDAFRRRAQAVPEKVYLAAQRVLYRYLFNSVRLMFLRPDWCVVV
ncbi:hypothetical protein [Desulfovirgula thermocuniculi]|uniref:hypothetical protein n=1 Tax=Desulfovirgula thermocuniculi TaxID=348842 RepID=UPI0004271177|nr:hypothetical protein [Desulfovirgula thermocuniculi]